jgi:hypothetical protein
VQKGCWQEGFGSEVEMAGITAHLVVAPAAESVHQDDGDAVVVAAQLS